LVGLFALYYDLERLGPAVKSNFKIVRCWIERSCSFFSVKFFDVAQHQNDSVSIGQLIDTSSDRHSVFREFEGNVRRHRAHAFVDPVARRIETRQQFVDLCPIYYRTSPFYTQMQERTVHEYPMKPGRQLCIALEGIYRFECMKKRILKGVAGIIFRPQIATRDFSHIIGLFFMSAPARNQSFSKIYVTSHSQQKSLPAR
jgi:hypothetical protein